MNKKQITLRQPYAITLSKHRLNVHEMRIMFRIIETLQSDIKYNKSVKEVGDTIFDNKILRIRTKYLLPEGSQNYGYVKKAIKSLREKSIVIEKKDPKKGASEIYTGIILKGQYYDSCTFI